jgi:hypothetical protein
MIKHYNKIVNNANRRTRKLGLRSDLTLSEWFDTLRDFSFFCCFCGTHPASDLEHFIPVSKGGGTTRKNVLPACRYCNSQKANLVPFVDEMDDIRFSISRLRRALDYLEQFGTVEIPGLSDEMAYQLTQNRKFLIPGTATYRKPERAW